MEFVKLVGSGNDFVFLDNRSGAITRRKELAVRICDRKFGVGADGLVLIEKTRKADVLMRIFNPDGSEAEMCGNALRCTGRFVRERRISGAKKVTVETKAGIFTAESVNDEIRAGMRILGVPRLDLVIPVSGKKHIGHFIDTGVPHTVLIVSDVKNVDIRVLGGAIRHHRLFHPKGTNVDWVETVGKNTLKIRTYERGVEDETLSCGTGTVAGAVIAFLSGLVEPPVTVIAASGELLTVTFTRGLDNIFLQGKTHRPFSGRWSGK